MICGVRLNFNENTSPCNPPPPNSPPSLPSPIGATALVARAWPYRYGTYGVESGAPSTYTEASNYTEGTMILDLLDTPTNKLVFRGTGTAVIGGPESNALTADALGRSRSVEVAFNRSAGRAYIEPMIGLRTTWTLCKNLLPRSGAMPAALGCGRRERGLRPRGRDRLAVLQKHLPRRADGQARRDEPA